MAVHAGPLACGDAHRQRELAVCLEGRREMRYPLVQRGLIALVLVHGQRAWCSRRGRSGVRQSVALWRVRHRLADDAG